MNNEINEVLHKEIDLIQACITRMADCSFKLKEWYISLARDEYCDWLYSRGW